MRELHITTAEANQRLDKYLKKYLNKAPGSFIYKMLRKKNIKINRAKADGSEILQENDAIQLFLADETIDSFREVKQVQEVPFPVVIYEDDHMLLVNKPSGLLTQKSAPTDLSLNDEILYYLQKTKKYDLAKTTIRPSACNRLDRNTSGLVLAGIDMAGLQFLSEILKKRTAKKEYLCIVHGVLPQPVHLKGYLLKAEKTNRVTLHKTQVQGSAAVETFFTPLSDNGSCTLVKAELITGKTHQIRSHLASIGHPIIGDRKYGDRNVNQRFKKAYGVTDQLLHARYVTFPETEGTFSYLSGRCFAAEVPEIFRQCMTGEHLHE